MIGRRLGSTPMPWPTSPPPCRRLATPSRLLILTELRQGPLAVTELADAIGMEQSAVSHQLRLLRNLGLVTGTRSGRSIVYNLYDNHVAQLLDEAIYHSEHLRLGSIGSVSDGGITRTSGGRLPRIE